MTFEFKIKCVACGLHYTVLSWSEEWAQEHKGGFCPECGTKGGKLLFEPTMKSEEIFSLVPGNSPLREIS